MAVDTEHQQIDALELRPGMTVRMPADFKHPAGEWMTVERAVKYALCMFVKFTDGTVHHPTFESPYQVKP